MAATTGTAPRREPDEPDREALKNAIRSGVLLSLGEPGWPGRVQVRPLWDGFYRVNLLLREDLGCERVAGSYFLKADGEGNILTSSPPLRRPGPPAPRTGRF